MTITVAYQGIPGSFSCTTAEAMFGHDINRLETFTFRDLFEHVKTGRARYGIVPIENSLAGSVHENYDLLAEFDCRIVAEHYLPVQLHLLTSSTKNVDIGNIRRVFSHPKALEQCSNFFEQNRHCTQVGWSDTASAAEHIKQLNEADVAAIASKEAADFYGLHIIARQIQNHKENITRFVAITASHEPVATPQKASLLITLRHEPGSLVSILAAIAAQGINLTKIESRPIEGRHFEYLFSLDCELCDRSTTTLPEMIDAIAPHCLSCRVLGLYQKGLIPSHDSAAIHVSPTNGAALDTNR
jgi:prephenate dehydratase